MENDSVDATDKCGNAATRYRDSIIHYERGAIGYSSIATGCAHGFFPDHLYAEIGNIGPAADPDDTSWTIVNTHLTGATHFPNSQFMAYELRGDTNKNFWRNHSGNIIATLDSELGTMFLGGNTAPTALGGVLTLRKTLSATNQDVIALLNEDGSKAFSLYSSSGKLPEFFMFSSAGTLLANIDGYYSSVISPQNFATTGGLYIGSCGQNCDNGGWGLVVKPSVTGAAKIDGIVNLSTLTASLPICTDASKNLTSTCPGDAPVLSGTTGSIGGGVLLAGACTSGTVTVTSSTTAMSVVATPVTYPGDGVTWAGYVSTAGTVTVKVCAIVGLTPGASNYNVRVVQ